MVKNIRKIALSALGVLVLTTSFIACSSDNTSSSTEQVNQTEKSVKSSYVNPFEEYGVKHNEVLVNTECYKESDIASIINSVNNYYGENVVSASDLENVGYNLQNNTVTIDENLFLSNGYTTNSAEYIFNFIEDIFSIQEENITLVLSKTYDAESGIDSMNFSESEKKKLYVFFSIFRNSIQFWNYQGTENQNNNYSYITTNYSQGPGPGWLRWIAVGIVDAAAGGVFAATGIGIVGASIIGAVASAAALTVDEIHITIGPIKITI